MIDRSIVRSSAGDWNWRTMKKNSKKEEEDRKTDASSNNPTTTNKTTSTTIDSRFNQTLRNVQGYVLFLTIQYPNRLDLLIL